MAFGRKDASGEWARTAAREVETAREMLDHWVKEMRYYVRGDGSTLAQPHREKLLCEASSMILVAGALLDSITRVFIRRTSQPRPHQAWSQDLADSVTELFAAASNIVQQDPYLKNVRSRFDDLCHQLPRWVSGSPRTASDRARALHAILSS